MQTPKQIIRCPFCGQDKIELKVEDFKHISKFKSRITKGKFWIYRCANCKEGFTSTESDTISYKTWKHKYL